MHPEPNRFPNRRHWVARALRLAWLWQRKRLTVRAEDLTFEQASRQSMSLLHQADSLNLDSAFYPLPSAH